MIINLTGPIVLVHDFEQAIDYYTRIFDARLIQDAASMHDTAVVLLALGTGQSRLSLMEARHPQDKLLVGRQTGTLPIGLLHCEDLSQFRLNMKAMGVFLLEMPSGEQPTLQLEDLYGNRWLIRQSIEPTTLSLPDNQGLHFEFC